MPYVNGSKGSTIEKRDYTRNKMAGRETAISKTMGGYAVSFDSYRIDMTQRLFDSIRDTLYECRMKDSKDVGHIYAYWLGHLMGVVKPQYKRVKCVLCKKDIHKKDMMDQQQTSMARHDVHKKCFKEYRKIEAAQQLLRDGSSEYKKKKERYLDRPEEMKGLASACADGESVA